MLARLRGRDLEDGMKSRLSSTIWALVLLNGVFSSSFSDWRSAPERKRAKRLYSTLARLPVGRCS